MTQERFGTADRVPHLKMLFLDTDSDTLHSATAAGALDPSEVIPARLNRPAHYLKPRRNGRSLIEGWFDPQTLYKIPRNPATVGMRALGRLAFLDHYKLFAEKLVGGLDACTHADALGTADRTTSIISFGIAGALAGLAGVLIAPVGAVDLNFGFLIMLGGFYAAILGGFGSLGGVVVGGFLIGFVQYVIGSYWWVNYQQVLPFVLLIAIIAVKPTGLFTKGQTHARL